MTWSHIGIFAGGLITGGFLALGFAVWILAPILKNMRRSVDLLAARRKPGRKPGAAQAGKKKTAPGDCLPPGPALDGDGAGP